MLIAEDSHPQNINDESCRNSKTVGRSAACDAFVSQLNCFHSTHKDTKVQDDALRVLGRILLNLQESPEESRFRRLRCFNERLRSMLTEVSGGANLLNAVGFISDGNHWQMEEGVVPLVPEFMAAFTDWTTKLEEDRFRRERDARIEKEREKEKLSRDHFRKSVTKRAQQDQDRKRLLAKIEADKREREAEARCSVPPSLHRASRPTVERPETVDSESLSSNLEERMFIRDGSARVTDPPAKPSLVRLRTPKRRRTSNETSRIATLDNSIIAPAGVDFERKPSARACTPPTPMAASFVPTAATSAPIIVRRYSQAVMSPPLSSPLVQPLVTTAMPPRCSMLSATVHSMHGLPTTTTRWLIPGALTARADYRSSGVLTSFSQPVVTTSRSSYAASPSPTTRNISRNSSATMAVTARGVMTTAAAAAASATLPLTSRYAWVPPKSSSPLISRMPLLPPSTVARREEYPASSSRMMVQPVVSPLKSALKGRTVVTTSRKQLPLKPSFRVEGRTSTPLSRLD